MKEKILNILKQTDDYVSGEEISQSLGITRSAVWKHIKALKEMGCNIDSVTNKGYRLVDSSAVFNANAIKDGLKTHCIGKELVYLKTVDSTNDEVKRRAAAGAAHGLVVVSDEQTVGKGRLGRVWKSPKGSGVWFSILVRPDTAPNEVAVITLVAGLGVCNAIRSFTGCNAMIKWPNDIIINNKKVCGILTEMNAEADRINYAVIGIGINVNTDSFPKEISHKATSLKLETDSQIMRADFLKEVLYQTEKCLDDYFLNVNSTILKEYSAKCATLGRQVSFERNGSSYTGVAKSISKKGELVVELPDLSNAAVGSGEVTVQGIY